MDMMGRWIVIAILITGGICLNQSDINRLATDINIKAEVVDNLANNGQSHDVKITLQNIGNTPIPTSGWRVFFHYIFLLFPEVFPKNKTVILETGNVKVDMIQGDLYSFEPVYGFKAIQPGAELVITLISSVWSVSKTDFMPNWYIVPTNGNGKPRILSSTKTLNYVQPFATPRQWKRNNKDQYNPFTAQERQERLEVMDAKKAVNVIVPTPKSLQIDDSEANIIVDKTWRIYGQQETMKAADHLHAATNIPTTRVLPSNKQKVISLSIDPSTSSDLEHYTININATNGITLTGVDASGLFYAVQSMLSILIHYNNTGIPSMSVMDGPRFGYRGMHLDVARNFHTTDDVKKLMRVMAMYKLNKLHLHLSDDEGWRLEIPGLPELTQIGSKRCHDLNESSCIIPQWGSGPFTNSSGTGHFNSAEYKDILQTAKSLHIEVIPEFDMPGHAHAAIIAMENRYKKYLNLGNKQAAEEYRLIDPDDKSVYLSVQQWMDDAINPCIESTYAFIDKVVGEVKKLHEQIQPLKTYHFGGDEVASGAWKESPKCKKFLRENPKYKVSKGLKKYFAEQVSEITFRHGVGMRGWEDGFMDGSGNPFSLDSMNNTDMSSNPWDNIWEWGASARAYKLANAGYKVVMSQATDLYFDQPYEPDPEERGLYWATRYTDTYKVFGFLPDSLYDNIDVKRSGEPLSKVDVCGADMSKCDRLEKPENIIGMQGQLWSETVRTSENMDSMIFPRLLAVAERAWYKAEFEAPEISPAAREEKMNKEWTHFANTLGYKELKRLDNMGVAYRVPPPGARVENNLVKASTTFPGLPVQYKVGSASWKDITDQDDITWQENFYLRTLSSDGKRESRHIRLLGGEPIPGTIQSTVDYIANHVTVKIEVVDNLDKVNNAMTVRLSLTNTHNMDIKAGTWRIHLYSLYGFIDEDLPCGLRVGHVDGGLYYVTPRGHAFKGLYAGKTIMCTIRNYWWTVTRTDQMPNWYVSATGMKPKVIKDTVDETLSFVGEFDTPAKWKRTVLDLYNPFNASDRYSMNKRNQQSTKDPWRIVPTPNGDTIIDKTQTLRLNVRFGWTVIASTDFYYESTYLADHFSLPVKTPMNQDSRSAKKKVVFIKLPQNNNPEGYVLEVSPPDSITISAEDARGAMHGVQTLISLAESSKGELPQIKLSDRPRFEYRGLMVDVARNFKPKKWLYRLMDVMAMYKLNKLHLHLSDDEGWRVEIPGLPELTQVGGHRCHSDVSNECVVPALGSGPDSTTSGSGFYTAADYRDILRHANQLHIDIIPEIDVPGHSSAAISSMLFRETKIKHLHETGVSDIPKSYILSDIGLDGSVKSVQKWKANAINPCINSSYSFIEKVVDGFISLHKDVKPLKIFHIGGDEVAEGSWANSEHCKHKYRNGNIPSTGELQQEFVTRVSKILSKRNLNMAAWEDGMYAHGRPNPVTDYTPPVYAFTWSNQWSNDKAKRVSEFADAGYKVVLPLATHLYFDHPQEPNPEERGLYWATRYTDTKKVFGFMPDHIYRNADVDRMGQPVDFKKICNNKPCPSPKKPENIIGMQGTLFSETVRSEDHFHYMLFPRLLALAERAWHKASWEDLNDEVPRDAKRKEDWGNFADTLGHKEMPRLEKKGIKYRVPPPGGIMPGGKLEVNTLYPNHVVEFSEDSGKTWKTVRGGHASPRTDSVLIRARSPTLNRPSRAVEVTSYTEVSSATVTIASFCLTLMILIVKPFIFALL